ncbi:hypothetical protein LOD99_7434 [Oopsacas minuta]|uniref:Transposase Tc1-like domain-containing protein n=1 Tax=Oopsacas minuta TaxID=111878 RepID=A0AAV7JVB5_9METZ|nr:hypothetical protein LOD99_7434 [Oopsacas minuta]
MPSKPRITIENRANLILLSESGHTQREVAKMVGCSQKSVAEILKKHRLTGTVRDLAIPGRPRVTTKRQDNLLVRKCKKDRFKTATQIKAEVLSEYSIKLSTSTVQRRLRGAGLFGRKPRRKPRLTTSTKETDFPSQDRTRIGILKNGQELCSVTNLGSFCILMTGEPTSGG